MRAKNLARLVLLLFLVAGASLTQAAPTKMPAAAARPADTLPALGNWNYQFEEDPLEASWSWIGAIAASGPFETRVVFHYKDARNYLLLRMVGDGKKATLRFWRVADGKLEKLGEPEATISATEGKLTLQRTSWRMRALWNSRVVVSAYSSAQGEKIGASTQGKAELTGERVQTTEKVFFQDDFMRAQGPNDPESSGGWYPVSGLWKTSGVLNPRGNAEMNPNPFVYRADLANTNQNGTALVTLGEPKAGHSKWFWSDYTVTASLRATLKSLSAPLVANIVAYYQPDGTAVTGAIDFRAGRASLSIGNRVLATSAPFAVSANQWHRVFLDPGPGTLRLIIDNVERVRADQTTAATDALAQGPVALQANIGGGNYVDYDDVRVATSDAIRDDFHSAAVGRWDDAAGAWKTRTDATHDRLKLSDGIGLTLTGDPQRTEGSVETSFNLTRKTGTLPGYGVAFAARDARNYYLARVRHNGQVVLEIVEYTDGNGKIIAGAKITGAVQPAVAVEWRDGIINAHNGATVATAAVPDVPAGRVGAWADAPAGVVAMTSFRAFGAPPNWGEGALPDRILKDHLMKNWASKANAWKQTGDTWWHTGDFFRDATLSVPLPALAGDARVTLLLGNDPSLPDSGARVVAQQGEKGLQLQLFENGQALKTINLAEPPTKPGAPDLAASPASDVKEGQVLRVLRQPLDPGHVLLRVALDNRVLCSETPNTAKDVAPGATRLGVRLEKATAPNWEKVSAETSHMIDYTFTSAPVDWETTSGNWEMKERWTCTPTWGFFAGTDSVNPTLWSRFALQGDYTLEAYLANPMDMTRGERDPMDINITTSGDGRDLASGYSFLFAAKSRSENRILRGDEIAWQKGYEAPPNSSNTHQDWFYLRIERRQTPQGAQFRYIINGREYTSYVDPKPLVDAGRLALWSYNGGLSIARVRVWYSGIQLAEERAPAPVAPATAVLENSLGQWKPRVENAALSTAQLQPVTDAGHNALKITNNQSGSDWTVYVTKKPFDAKERPKLRFNYRVPAGVAVNLYAKVDGKWRELVFTGPEGNTNSPSLGRIEGILADNKWHSASFNLLDSLTANGGITMVEALAFAAPDREYLRAGIGGNHLGATYYISDLSADADKPGTPTTVAALK